MDDRDDVDLVNAARIGDADAFTILFKRYWRFVVGAVRRYTRDVHQAQDIAQEAFVRLHQSLWCMDDRVELSAWLRRVATNLAVDGARRREARPERELVDPERVLEVPAAPQVTDSVAEPQGPVWGAMARLTRYESSLLFLRFARGLTYRDIARECGLSVSAVKVAVHRGRRRLGRALEA